MAEITVYVIADCDCGRTEHRTWVTEDSAATHAECPDCHNLRAVLSRKEHYTAHVPSTSRKRFQPHWNGSFGCEVESPEHMKHLQAVHGTEDFALSRIHSDGSTDYTSRDIDTGAAEKRKKSAQILEESMATGDPELDYNPDGSDTVTELTEEDD